MDIVLPSRVSVCTVALFLSAAMMTPCGVIHSWCTRSATKRGPAVGTLPTTFQANPPLTYRSSRCGAACG
jgi:hypothetical protein